MSLRQARKNEEVVALADSQMLRFIDDLNNVCDIETKAKEIRKEIKILKRSKTNAGNKKLIKHFYDELDKIQFKPDYMNLVVDNVKDFEYVCKNGFYINNIKYKRMLGTGGGVKNSTIVFVSERLYPQLLEKVDNGRDKSKEMIPAKFESYRALTCSGSNPVSYPKGILVVEDCETAFYDDIIEINDENEGEPTATLKKNELVKLTESDGYGLISPSFSRLWVKELGEDLTKGEYLSGMCVRNSWLKGMLFTFDFHKFAEKIAKKYIVKDIWGNEIDVRNVDIIITASMLKLWDSYKSCEHYLECCKNNGYTFSITKLCPKELENERNLNYQFIQSYKFTDEQIDELINPTVTEIKEVLGGDYRKSILFLAGMYLNDKNVVHIQNDIVKALMIEKTMINDPFIRKKIHQMIRKRIDDSKMGVIKVNKANYSIVSGDPFSLCQSVFGLEVTGLLKKGEFYNKYWVQNNVDKVACYRAPMSCHNNIRTLDIVSNEQTEEWYKYMNTVTIFNSWDTTAHALNGCDKDSDSVLTTNCKVLIDNVRKLPAIMCVQRKAVKKIVTEEDLIKANIDGFGDEIGDTTNKITIMTDIQSDYKEEDIEYKILNKRIMCGQLYQQNAIDKLKGIIAKPMPKSWYDWRSNKDDNMGQAIAADKKPYFMRYVYPELMARYNKYVKSVNKKSIREFTYDLLNLQTREDLTDEQFLFLEYYNRKMPVGLHNSVMNRICWKIEKEFEKINFSDSEQKFDKNILKFKDVKYSNTFTL